MGAVYQAEHVDLEKRVALKTLLGAAAREPKTVERFRQEARAASKIGSPFICDVTDFGQLPDGQVFYVMEYIDGPSLRRVLDVDKAVDAPRAIAILRQTCKALGAAHAKGIIHLDVKPDNIMLATSGRRGGMVKVVDFGIAGLISAEPLPEGASPEERIVGTPDYLAPERIRGKGYDHRSDIYSLGAMAYEMLTGICPFWDDDLMTTITKHVTDKPKPLRERAPERDIPDQLETVVLQMLAKNPAERPQSMAVVEAMLCDAQIGARLQTEWDDLELPEVDEDWRKKLAERMPSPRSRKMRRVAMISGLVAVVGIALALYFGLRRPKEIFTPVYVEVTKTDEPESVAPWLRKAAVAAAAERFLEPPNDSALYYIERAEGEAKRVGTASGGASQLRRLYGNQFRSLGNALLEAKLTDLAAVRYGEALRFLPGDADLRTKLGLAAAARSPSEKESDTSTGVGAASRKPLDEAARMAAELFSAVAAGKYSQARVTLPRLLAADTDGRHTARLADEFRRRAQALWESGKREQAKPLYQIVAELDPKDTVSAERAKAKDELPPPPPPPPPPEPAPAPIAEGSKSTKKKAAAALGLDPLPDEGTRDRPASVKAAAEGAAALGRGDWAKAQVAFNRAVRADASNPEAVAGLAEVAFENARYTEALDYARRAVRLQSKTVKYHVIVGDAYFKLLRYDDALAAYKRAAALSPGAEGIKARIGRVMARLGQ
jgi:tetratricopeptide (TPR) repeat protein